MYDFPKMYLGCMRLVKKFDAPQLHALFASELRAAWPPNLREAEARWKFLHARWENTSETRWSEKRQRSFPDPGMSMSLTTSRFT